MDPERLESNKRFENFPKYAKKWLINVSGEPNTRDITLHTGKNLKEILIWC